MFSPTCFSLVTTRFYVIPVVEVQHQLACTSGSHSLFQRYVPPVMEFYASPVLHQRVLSFPELGDDLLDVPDVICDTPPAFHTFDEFFTYYFPPDADQITMADVEGDIKTEEKHDDGLSSSSAEEEEHADEQSKADDESKAEDENKKVQPTGFPAAELPDEIIAKVDIALQLMSKFKLDDYKKVLQPRASWGTGMVASVLEKHYKSYETTDLQLVGVAAPTEYVGYDRKDIDLPNEAFVKINEKYGIEAHTGDTSELTISTWADQQAAWDKNVIRSERVLIFDVNRNNYNGPYTFQFDRQLALATHAFGQNIHYQYRTFCIACRHCSTRGDLHPWCWRCYVLSGFVPCGIETFCRHCTKMTKTARDGRKAKIKAYMGPELTEDQVIEVLKNILDNKLARRIVTQFDANVCMAIQLCAAGTLCVYPVPATEIIATASYFSVGLTGFKKVYGVKAGEALPDKPLAPVQPKPKSTTSKRSLKRKTSSSPAKAKGEKKSSPRTGKSSRPKRQRTATDYSIIDSGNVDFESSEQDDDESGGGADDKSDDGEGEGDDLEFDTTGPTPPPAPPSKSKRSRPIEQRQLPPLSQYLVIGKQLNRYMTADSAFESRHKEDSEIFGNLDEVIFFRTCDVTINIAFPWNGVWAALAGVRGMRQVLMKKTGHKAMKPVDKPDEKSLPMLGMMLRGETPVRYVPRQEGYLLQYTSHEDTRRLATPVELYLALLAQRRVPPPQFPLKERDSSSSDEVVLLDTPSEGETEKQTAKTKELTARQLSKTVDKVIKKELVTPTKSPKTPTSADKVKRKLDVGAGDTKATPGSSGKIKQEPAGQKEEPIPQIIITSALDHSLYEYTPTPSLSYLPASSQTLTADMTTMLALPEFGHGAQPQIDLTRDFFGVILGAGEQVKTYKCDEINHMSVEKLRELMTQHMMTKAGLMPEAPVHSLSWYHRVSAMRTLSEYPLQLKNNTQLLLIPDGPTSNGPEDNANTRPFIHGVDVGPRAFASEGTLTPTGATFLQRRALEVQTLLGQVKDDQLLTQIFVNRNLHINTLPYMRKQARHFGLQALGTPARCSDWENLRGNIDARYAYPVADAVMRYSEELSRLKFYTLSQREHDLDWLERTLLYVADEMDTVNKRTAQKLRLAVGQIFNKLYYHILDDYAIEAEHLSHTVYVRRQGFLGAMEFNRSRIMRGLTQGIAYQKHILE